MPTFVYKSWRKCKKLCSYWFTHCHLILEVSDAGDLFLDSLLIHESLPVMLSYSHSHGYTFTSESCLFVGRHYSGASGPSSAAVMRKKQMLPVRFSYPQYPVGFGITETCFSYTMSKLFGHQ